MQAWTDVILSDAPAGVGETDTVKAEHVNELRSEAQRSTLWVPWQDERPTYCGIGEYIQGISPETTIAIAPVGTGGVIRSLWTTGGASACNLVVYVDQEPTPRINIPVMTMYGVLNAGVPYFKGDYFGNHAGSGGSGGYFFLPIPYTNGFTAKLVGTGGVSFWQLHYSQGAPIDYGRYAHLNVSGYSQPIHGGTYPVGQYDGPGAFYGITMNRYNTTNNEFDTHFVVDPPGDDYLAAVWLGGGSGAAGFQGYGKGLWSSGNEDFFLDGWDYGSAEWGTAAHRSRSVGTLGTTTSPAQRAMYRFFDQSPICFDSQLTVLIDDEDESGGSVSGLLYCYTEG